ncbi:2-nitropropane dioxygenase [Kaistia sp. 32K]|uniref:NAD(P)H-dependent flavin oxidoreductase n=1 Tax=Kaistia sp. 32K TaxID=2795690 RepID=UPI0019154B0B|nr:nitronate monooxygenase family protein [Kaistia sp. 32K]BCP51829.1 2-nitropropane dioxygenase [Kaistia sp. 32K]
MTNWADRRILDLFGIEHPILLAPMAGFGTPALAIAVAEAGGLGALACATISPDQARENIAAVRAATARPINMNFFCHGQPEPDPAREAAWRARLAPYYRELGLDPAMPVPASNREPFSDAFCAVVEDLRPEIVSFHFGLPEKPLLDRVKAAGAKVIASATTVREARYLEAGGCDAIIAQGAEAGGHRGMFLTSDVSGQVGTFALVPQVVDAVGVPVIAAGGIADARGVVAALALGASAVQIGTAFLLGPEAKVAPQHRRALETAEADETAITNVFTGRPARGIVNRLMRDLGRFSSDVPQFPLAGGALAPLRAETEPVGSRDFMSLWSGQAARLAQPMPAGDFVRTLVAEAQAKLA